MTPNPLDLILPLAVPKFALSLRSSVLPAPATGAPTAMGSPGPAGDIAASFPGSHPCEVRGAVGSGVSDVSLGQTSCPASLSRADGKAGLYPQGGPRGPPAPALAACLGKEAPGWESVRPEGTTLIPADTSGARVSGSK